MNCPQKEFASVAEAAAHYAEQGFETAHAYTDGLIRRVMLHPDGREAIIGKPGLLRVIAFEVEAAPA